MKKNIINPQNLNIDNKLWTGERLGIAFYFLPFKYRWVTNAHFPNPAYGVVNLAYIPTHAVEHAKPSVSHQYIAAKLEFNIKVTHF